jgi:hypothetical protein
MIALPRRRQRASTSATRMAAAEPSAKPPSASLNVNQPALAYCERSSQRVWRMSESGGSRNCSTSRPRTRPSQAAMPSANTTAAGAQSTARRPTRRPSVPRGTTSTMLVTSDDLRGDGGAAV